ncbi:hypothetical protein ACFX1X_013262 [Malus domestica]
MLGDKIVYTTRRGTRLLNLSDFMDKAHSRGRAAAASAVVLVLKINKALVARMTGLRISGLRRREITSMSVEESEIAIMKMEGG